MNPQLRRHLGSTAFIIGFFLLWEALCWIFNVSDIVVPKPSTSVRYGAPISSSIHRTMRPRDIGLV